MGGYPGSNLGYFGEVGVPGAPLDPLIYVARAGSAMYGPLLMSADDPTQPREPVTLVYFTRELAAAEATLRGYTDAETALVRQYVDAQDGITLQDANAYTDQAIASLPPVDLSNYLPLTGGVITGNLQVNGDTNVQNLNAAQGVNTGTMFYQGGIPLSNLYLSTAGGWINGNLGVFGDMNVSSPGRYLLNGVPISGIGQTPWTQPIDAADFPLTSPNSLVFEVAGFPAMRISPGSGVECQTLLSAPEVRCLGPFVTVRVAAFGGGSSIDFLDTLSFNTSNANRMVIDPIGNVRVACDATIPAPPVGVIGNYTHMMIGGAGLGANAIVGTLDLYGYSTGGAGNPWCGILAFVNAANPSVPQKQVAAISAQHQGGTTNNSGSMSLMVNVGNNLQERLRLEPGVANFVDCDVNISAGKRYLINGYPVADFAAAIQDLENRVARLESK